MDESKAYIKLTSNFENWRWFKNGKTLHVFLYLLAKGNLEPQEFCRDTINRGSLLTTNERIANDCGMTIQNVRTALSNLSRTGDISRERRNHYQIITVTDFDSYIVD